jgi:hypothetical protein
MYNVDFDRGVTLQHLLATVFALAVDHGLRAFFFIGMYELICQFSMWFTSFQCIYRYIFIGIWGLVGKSVHRSIVHHEADHGIRVLSWTHPIHKSDT